MKKITRLFPKEARDKCRKVRDVFLPAVARHTMQWLRMQKPLTKILGPYYQTNHEFIEINVTQECNLNCLNCAKSCRQAPSREEISVAQIQKFIQESIEQRREWKQIMLNGGEPTLHPRLLDIIQLLLSYKEKFAPQAGITLFTNGYGGEVNAVLKMVPQEVIIANSRKSSPVNTFYCVNIAPVDLWEYKFADYSNACVMAETCTGLGLNCYGYYFCGIAGAVDRVFGFDIGRKQMPRQGDMLTDQRVMLCRYCGFFQRRKYKLTLQEEISPTWREAYKKYEQHRPHLSYY